MAIGRLDLFIAKIPLQTVVLTLNCSNSGSELLTIPQQTQLTLQRGTLKHPIQLQFLEGRECFADFIEMNFVLARKLQLHALRRYLVEYKASDRILTINPSPLSEATATLSASTLNHNIVSVGYELLSQLGIPERHGSLVKVRQGKHAANFRLHVPANLSDDRLRLPSLWFQKWSLSTNRSHLLQYDQRSATLSLAPNSIFNR